MIMQKQNAIDFIDEYLSEKSISNWQRTLINIVKNDWVLTQENLNNLFNELLQDNNLKEKVEIKYEEEKEKNNSIKEIKNFYISELNHIKGVNALAEWEKIKFSDSCNVIYWLNWSWKSWYFRILHGLVWWEKKNEILHNINWTNTDFEIEMKYLIDWIEKLYFWKDKNNFWISPFDKIKVFDSEYTSFYIDKRDNKTNLYPLWIHLFEIIIKWYDYLKNKLEEYKKSINIPDIQLLVDIINNQDIKDILNKNTLTDFDKEKLENYYEFSDLDKKEIELLEKQKKDLESINNQDTIKILEKKIALLNKISKDLNLIKKLINIFYTETKKNIDCFKTSFEIANKKKEQIEVLKDIIKNEEWEKFIKSWNSYYENLNEEYNKNICIYCHQELWEKAKNLISAYWIFINDESQKNLEKSINELLLIKENNKINIILPDLSDLENGRLNLIEIKSVFNYYETIILNIESFISNKSYIEIDIKNFNYVTWKIRLSYYFEKINLEKLNLTESKKDEEIKKIKEKLDLLNDKKQISEYKSKIEKYFSVKKEISDIWLITINTKAISDLQKKVIKELISKEFKETFKKELRNLNKYIDIDILDDEVSKWTQKIEKKIKWYSIKKICSEWEQKTIAIAHFLTESILDKNNYPIILDDPVNSLDHEIADKLAKRLLEISTERQIIIFTHNKLFLDSLYYLSQKIIDDISGIKLLHKCKLNDWCVLKEWRHVFFYNTRKQNINSVWKITFKHQENLGLYIREAKKELDNYNDTIRVSVSSKLKSAIECFIDEKILAWCEPIKNHKTKESISWEALKKLNPDKDLIDKLYEYWGTLSNRWTHLSWSSSENPITETELNEIIDYINNNK